MDASNPKPPAGIEREAGSLAVQGVSIKLLDQGGQCFVRVTGLVTPSPPWGAPSHDILIAVPMAFETAGLDGFYLRQPYSFNSGTHPRVNGQKIDLDGATWQLVSWHYSTDKSWTAGQDNLASHIEHCRGFFLNRKAINAY
jgi:hypothetical protein